MAKEKVANVTRVDIEKYLRLDRERLELQRQAKDKGRLQEAIENKLWDWTKANGGDAQSCERSGYVLAIKSKAGTVKWADEFVRVAGETEAQRLRDAAPRAEFLSVEQKL